MIICDYYILLLSLCSNLNGNRREITSLEFSIFKTKLQACSLRPHLILPRHSKASFLCRVRSGIPIAPYSNCLMYYFFVFVIFSNTHAVLAFLQIKCRTKLPVACNSFLVLKSIFIVRQVFWIQSWSLDFLEFISQTPRLYPKKLTFSYSPRLIFRSYAPGLRILEFISGTFCSLFWHPVLPFHSHPITIPRTTAYWCINAIPLLESRIKSHIFFLRGSLLIN